ncbi:DUF3291 domain-containing protein [Alteromonas alba]|uniref:DUF3291 domain-containing protein n=1 Tax=Alteromonas alba TaxID=2079529 RepID=A0A2S9V5N9_9ALTE|nr:DUF3291 domain-containing protein [Alteromonas alba]PRO71685.1 DUF3291 domain-containing protein [Alteromonas alba]
MHLAQLNIARPKFPMDSIGMADFVNNLDPINTVAENSPGFIWRLKDDSGNATSIQIFDDPELIVNMSVWQDIASLKQFMFKTHHIDFLKRKKEWFVPLDSASYVMWGIEEGHIPTVEEAEERLLHLREHGESDYAFSFKHSFNK